MASSQVVQKEDGAGAAGGTLAGGVMCLLAFLPYLLMKRKVAQNSDSCLEAHKFMTEYPSSLKAQLGHVKAQTSDPEMSFVDLGTGQNDAPSCDLLERKTNSSSFRAYLNPMNMGKSEEGLQERAGAATKEGVSEERIKPALMPLVWSFHSLAHVQASGQHKDMSLCPLTTHAYMP